MDIRPLAEIMRPKNLNEVVGQTHLIGQDEILRKIVDHKQSLSLILWGPPGSGKTTLARIIAEAAGSDFIEISAVASGIADVKLVIKRAEQNRRLGLNTLLFVDEIHRFNKSQQDAFLPYVESGLITLIGATTENPSFEVISPLLSRSKVLVLKPLAKTEIKTILHRAAQQLKVHKRVNAKILDYIAETSGGDARIALGTLELSLTLTDQVVDLAVVKRAAQTELPAYDNNGEMHYNLISALIKSLRASDANAVFYYLARMLEAGEDPKFIARRLVIFASEDIGIASSPALNLAVSTFAAVERIGMPECALNLFHCALALAASKKSRVVNDAMQKAFETARQYPNLPIPIHLRNATTTLMKDLDYGKDYQWQAGFRPTKGLLPDELKDLNLF